MKRSGVGKTWTAVAGTALLALGLAATGCRDDGSSGTFVVVSGSGTSQTNSQSQSSGSFSLVTSDPGGGTILESADGKQRKIAGVFHENVTLASSYTWILDAPVFVGDDAATKANTITIEAGTTILGRGGTPPSMLVIRRGAKIMAEGTASAPIVFTSAQPVGSRAAGDWGGLIINGQAPVNDIGPSGELPFGEGGSGKYGGTDAADSSGTLRYVRVEFAGSVFTSDDELNGIAFQGVGSGTTVDFVQVHKNADDGVEFFGGTVQVKHLVITGCQDDSIDWTSGWTGKGQFLIVQQYPGGGDNGIEADNLEADNDKTPRSAPILSNMTFVGPSDAGAASDIAILLRRGTAAKISNSILTGFNEYGLDIDDSATWNHAYNDAPASYNSLSGNLVVENTFFHDMQLGNFRDDAGDPQLDSVFNTHQANANQLVDPQLTDAQNVSSPDFRPQAGSPVLGTWVNPGDPFFEVVTYSGAMDSTTQWTAGWTTSSQN